MEHRDEQGRLSREASEGRRQAGEPRTRKAAATITAGELALVCARYDVGEITRVERLKRGSGSSPKIIIESSTGMYILKRLAPARSDPRRVAFGHELQLYLLKRGFPAPRLIGTRSDNNSMLQVRGNMYELYRYIHGRHDSTSLEDARDAGKTLGLLHRTLEEYQPTDSWVPQTGTYHDSAQVPEALARIRKRFDDPDRREVTADLAELYVGAAKEASRGQSRWAPGPYIHGDWHPGNMLFALPGPGSRSGSGSIILSGVVCVLDFDSARPGARVIDVANGALQFSLSRRASAGAGREGGSEGARGRAERSKSKRTTDELDLDRYRMLVEGYHSGVGRALGADERLAIPWLMIQALIAEAAMPIAITGRFGKIDPMGLLRVVRRKTRWIREQVELFRIGG